MTIMSLGLRYLIFLLSSWILLLEGCFFDGKLYDDSATPPGCFPVYCRKGDWLATTYVNTGCADGIAWGDPHIVTFDGYNYDYYGEGTYILAQEGFSLTPKYSVSAHFKGCFDKYSCTDKLTFDDNPSTSVIIGFYGTSSTTELLDLNVNGQKYTLPESGTYLVQEGRKTHPIFAWKHNEECIRLLGSSQISIEFCLPGPNSIHIHIPASEFNGKVYGLLGYFDGNQLNGFTARDGRQYGLEGNPDYWNPFINSWRIGTSRNDVHPRNESDPLIKKEVIRSHCREAVGLSAQTSSSAQISSTVSVSDLLRVLPEDRISAFQDSCEIDTCAVWESSSGHHETIQESLKGVRSFVQNKINTVINTRDDHEIPEPPLEPEVSAPGLGNENHRAEKVAVKVEVKFNDS
ncbi:zonadhesin-like [Palaemon carinicauda]|uniref:zonadhesin-like n=1 Tax=Palaemon carinicauda TaxID=392227 RepID=UPI0035B5FE5C